MSRRRAELPDVSSKHLRVLELRNETAYDTRAIRKLVVRCLRALMLKVRGCVRVTYSSVNEHHGVAAIGRQIKRVVDSSFYGKVSLEASGYVTRSGLNMALTVPRDPRLFSRDQFARLILHEALHWKGVRHEDMTDHQRYCSGPAPAWCLDVEVAFQPKPPVDPNAAREKKLAHAKAMLGRSERRLKLATTIVKRWKRRVSAAERALVRAAVVTVEPGDAT